MSPLTHPGYTETAHYVSQSTWDMFVEFAKHTLRVRTSCYRTDVDSVYVAHNGHGTHITRDSTGCVYATGGDQTWWLVPDPVCWLNILKTA